MKKNTLKDLDFKILQLLNDNSRKKFTSLAKDLGISRTTLQKKVDRLIENDFIFKYSIIINPNFFHKRIFYEIKTNPKEPKVLKTLKSLKQKPELIEGIIGDYSLIVKQNFLNNKDFLNNLNEIDNLEAETYRLIEILKTYKEHGNIFVEKDENIKQLNDLERKILFKLRDQGKKRVTTLDLAREFKVSQPTIHKKIKVLEDWNIIKKFTITINPTFFEYKIKFYMRIKVDPGQYEKVANKMITYPNVIDLYRTGENYGLLSVIRAKNIEEFNDFIKKMYEENPISDTKTILVVEGQEHDNYFFPTELITR